MLIKVGDVWIDPLKIEGIRGGVLHTASNGFPSGIPPEESSKIINDSITGQVQYVGEEVS